MTEGEVQAWRNGDIARARALIVKAHVTKEENFIWRLTNEFRQLKERSPALALKGADHWTKAAQRRLALAEIDTDDADRHLDWARACASNAEICARAASEWVTELIDPSRKRSRARGGLRLVMPEEPRR